MSAAALRAGSRVAAAAAAALASGHCVSQQRVSRQRDTPPAVRAVRSCRAGESRAAVRCDGAGLRSSTSSREHSFIHEADFTPQMSEIAKKVCLRTILAEGCYILDGVEDHIIERLAFGDKVFATKGSTLIEQGAENSDVFVVGHGLLSVIHDGVQVASIGPGQVIGLYTMLKKTAASADVRVDSDMAYVLVLRHSHFMGCLDGSPEVLERMRMLLRQREMQNKAAEVLSNLK